MIETSAGWWRCKTCGVVVPGNGHTCDEKDVWKFRAETALTHAAELTARVKELEDELAELRLASGALPGVPTLAQVANMAEAECEARNRVGELKLLLAGVLPQGLEDSNRVGELDAQLALAVQVVDAARALQNGVGLPNALRLALEAYDKDHLLRCVGNAVGQIQARLVKEQP